MELWAGVRDTVSRGRVLPFQRPHPERLYLRPGSRGVSSPCSTKHIIVEMNLTPLDRPLIPFLFKHCWCRHPGPTLCLKEKESNRQETRYDSPAHYLLNLCCWRVMTSCFNWRWVVSLFLFIENEKEKEKQDTTPWQACDWLPLFLLYEKEKEGGTVTPVREDTPLEPTNTFLCD